jgi:integrase
MDTKSLIVSPKIPKTDKYIPADVLQRLYDTVDNIRDLFYITWHCETGVRVSDIVGIKRKGRERQIGQEQRNIDWQGNRIYTFDHKKDEWRYVYFPEKVRSKLKLWLKERQNLGIKGRELFPFSEKTCGRILKRWCRFADFQHADIVGTHWCRHTFIRLSRRAGRDLKAVQQNTGDSIKTILEWYEALGPEDMARELNDKPLII